MRRRLFAAVSMTALLGAPAFAQDAEVNEGRTEPVDTATADNGNAANLIIGANGRVTLTNVAGPAVRVNSDNSLTTETSSVIQIVDQDANGNNVLLDGAVGVQVDPGITGDVTHSGSIRLNDTYEAEASDDLTVDDDRIDTNGDGTADSPDTEPDGAFAEDLNKIGLLVGELDSNFLAATGQSQVTGNITLNAGSGITVTGQDSYAVRVVAPVSGDLISSGALGIRGENSFGLSVEADIGGDVVLNQITAQTPGGGGASIEGNIGGGLRVTNIISVSGYRFNQRFASEFMALLDIGDDDIDSNSAIIIAGSIVDGVFIASTAGISQQSGSGAAIDIGQGGEVLTIGSATVPDDFDQASANADDDDAVDIYDHAIINRGVVSAEGLFDGKSSTAFLIGGRDESGQIRAVILEGQGFLNESQIIAIAHDAEAVAVRFGEGAQADTIQNTGTIDARGIIGFETDGHEDGSYRNARAYGLVLDEGSAIRQILNEGDILASIQEGVISAGASAVTINTDSVELLVNEGRIGARILTGAPSVVDDTNPERIAIDARNHNAGLTVRQQRGQDENNEDRTNTLLLQGDVLFGDGDDTLELLGGEAIGDVYFGAGADRLVINGAELTGAIKDSDANLTIDVTNGRIILSGTDSLEVAEANFNEGAELEIQINTDNPTGAFISASGAVTFTQGSDLSVSLGGLVANIQEFTLISADTLTFGDQTIPTATNSSFLYNAEIRTADGDPNTLILSLIRKSSDELGMNANEAAAYDEAFAAMTAIDSLGNAFASVQSADAFFGAYNQLLPEYASSAIQFALASNDAAAGALSSRLRNARMSPDELAGVWIQEFGYFADRNSTSFGPGYRGQGIGVAMGIDRPVGPFYAVGFHLVGSASEVEEIDGFDEPMVALSGQFGTYAALDLGGVDVSASFGVGYDYFETERNIVIDAFSTVNTAEWSGWHLTASAQAGRDYEVGNWILRPEASMTWLSLFESGYSEQNEDPDFAQLALIVDDRESSVLTAGATVTLARRFGSDLSWWSPSVRIGYRGELLGEEMDTVARFGETGNPFTLQSEALPGSGVLAGFGFSAGSQYTTFTFAYDADVRDQFVRHVARLVVRLTF